MGEKEGVGERGRWGSANGRGRENNELRGIMRIFDHTLLPPPSPPGKCGIKISHTRCSVYIWPGEGHQLVNTHTHINIYIHVYFVCNNQSQSLNSQHEK